MNASWITFNVEAVSRRRCDGSQGQSSCRLIQIHGQRVIAIRKSLHEWTAAQDVTTVTIMAQGPALDLQTQFFVGMHVLHLYRSAVDPGFFDIFVVEDFDIANTNLFKLCVSAYV